MKRGSRRLRRVAWTLSTLLALVVIGALLSWRIHKENAPEEYTPGEESKDITSAINERAAEVPAIAMRPARNSVSPRVADPLLDPGRTLPTGAPQRGLDGTGAVY